MEVGLFDAYINEGWGANLGHLALDLVGLIPGYGEAADGINAIWYLAEDPPEYLYAALSTISLIPVIGDLIGKGGKLAVAASKAAAKYPKMAKYGRVASRGADEVVKAGKVVRKTQQAIRAHAGEIDKFFDSIEKNDRLEKLHPHIPKMREALLVFAQPGRGEREVDGEG